MIRLIRSVFTAVAIITSYSHLLLRKGRDASTSFLYPLFMAFDVVDKRGCRGEKERRPHQSASGANGSRRNELHQHKIETTLDD